MQQSSAPHYDAADALKRGTLFPGLDLPFMNMVNMEDVSGTPLGEVMALCFVSHELQLYLDTHPQDTDAQDDYYNYSVMLKELTASYEQQYGPLSGFGSSPTMAGSWVDSEWPFE